MMPGLSTIGFVTRVLLKRFVSNKPEGFKGIKVQLSANVFSGNTLRTQCWIEKGAAGSSPTYTRRVLFETSCVETGEVVLRSGFFDCAAGEFVEAEGSGAGGAAAQGRPRLQASVAPRLAA
jgi:hypothetical protein